MKDLLITLAALSAICTCALIASPEGSFKKYIKLCCTLCVLAVIASLLPGAADLPEAAEIPRAAVEDLSDDAKNIVIEETKKRLCLAVKDAAYEKYGIDGDDISVDMALDLSDLQKIRITKITVQIFGLENAVKVTGLKNYVSDSFGCSCEVTFSE